MNSGIATFNWTNSRINYTKKLGLTKNLTNQTFSVRIRCKPTLGAGSIYLISMVEASMRYNVYITSWWTLSYISSINWAAYVNWVATTTVVSGVTSDIVVTWMYNTTALPVWISLWYHQTNSNQYFNGTMELVEIYNWTLTATEVALLYNNSLYKEIQAKNTIVDVAPYNGTFNDSMWKTLTNANVTLARWYGIYNGTSSVLTYASLGELSNFTMDCWVRINNNQTAYNCVMSYWDRRAIINFRGWDWASYYKSIRANLRNAASWVFSTSTEKVLEFNKRYHCAMTVDWTNWLMKFYVNWVQIWANVSITWTQRTGTDLKIWEETSYWFKWNIWRARVTNRVMTLSEITETYGAWILFYQ
jgi:hypothetical protein